VWSVEQRAKRRNPITYTDALLSLQAYVIGFCRFALCSTFHSVATLTGTGIQVYIHVKTFRIIVRHFETISKDIHIRYIQVNQSVICIGSSRLFMLQLNLVGDEVITP